MADTTAALTRPSFFETVPAAFHKAVETMQRRKLYRETFNGLNALSDSSLADIGLHRGELRRVAWDASRNL